MSQDKTETIIVPANSRRKFLGNLGLMGAGAVLAGCAPGMAQTPGKKNLDAAIFNFALNLEYLEAAFYLAAVGRLGELNDAGGGTAQVILPSGFDSTKGIPFTNADADIKSYANEVATDELNHVKVIRKVLGGAAVDRPVIDLSNSFVAAGKAASNGAIANFNPYANALFFLHGAFVFEDVGVTAYKGAARFLVDDKAGGNLENAAGILAVEAYHAGLIRTLLYARRADPTVANLNVAQTVDAISKLRASVGGGNDQGITADGSATGAANIVPADANSIAFSRTPRLVANIVFLMAGATKGGFFPNGLSSNSTDPNFATLLSL